MDSDDDFDLFTHMEDFQSPPLAKMKRLKKKLSGGLFKESVHTDEMLLVDAFADDEDFVTRIEDEAGLDVDVEGVEMEMDECAIEESGDLEEVERVAERELSTQRALDFADDDVDGGEGEKKLREAELDADVGNEKGRGKGKKRKKRSKTDDDGEQLDSGKAVSKRRSEKVSCFGAFSYLMMCNGLVLIV